MNSNIEKDNAKRYLAPLENAQSPMPIPEVLPNFDYSPGLRDLLDILFRRKWIIGILTTCFFVPTLIYNLNVKPVYQAQASVELSPYAAKVTKFEDVADPLNQGYFSETQVELLQSAALARRVVVSLKLGDHPRFNPGPPQDSQSEGILFKVKHALLNFKKEVVTRVRAWMKSDNKEGGAVDPELVELYRQKALEGYIKANLVVSLRNANIVSITFDSEDPKLARDVVNTLISEFIDWQMDRRVGATKIAKRHLEKQITIARDQLENTESELNKFASNTGIVSLDSRQNLIYQQLEQINAALAKIEAERIAKEKNYDHAFDNNLDTSPLIQQNALVQKLRSQYLDLFSEYEKLKVRYKGDHPTMKSLNAQMRQVAAKINSEQQRTLDVVKNDYLATLDTEKALQRTAEEKKVLALRLNDLASHYKILERDVEVNKEIYQSLLARSKEIDANVGTDLTNIKVVDYASLPLAPYKPKTARNVLLAVMLGSVLGIGAALLREHLDDSIKRIDEIPGRYWIPVLGVVPLVRRDEKRKLQSLVRSKPSAAFSEAIRMIRVSIQHSGSPDNPTKSILLTSSGKGEGKSTLAANLAQSFALSNEKVLLIEADLRRPSLRSYFSKNGRSEGLSEFLRGTCKYEEIVQKTGIQNLYFIAGGEILSNPTELLTSQRMKDLMNTSAGYFDRVILDAPPFTSDTLALGSLVNGVILVATLSQTHREALKIFRKDLLFTNARLLGSIINMFNANRYGAEGFYCKYYGRYEDSYGCTAEDIQVMKTLKSGSRM
ncbi:MAG: polysaccharide biosynthesis tyrosine autokinase [Desulforhabdus sp.]|jgi:capsular exopolysaccharide synthesis family protein|nr:polysaccharide biosynthesis tyrosine autokinase [Desulforhabdus sp.]